MERLVVINWVGDGCTWSAENVVPVIYESDVAFAVDLEAKVKEIQAAYSATHSVDVRFMLGGVEFDASHFFEDEYGVSSILGTYYMPEILTIDAWFAKYNKG
jgi:hypothetical protein